MRRPAAELALLALSALAAAVATPATARAETVWLCLPGMADNPCEIGMDTTVREPSGEERVESPEVPAQRPVDCFYVYPTVSNQPTPNADKSRDPELVSIAKYQAARFSQRCRVFAPIYRQRTLLALATAAVQDEEAAYAIAYGDVREAWHEYLSRHNEGRGVVLIGHSQGTRMLRELIAKEVDDDTDVRRRLVSALLLGGDVEVRAGDVVGGDFARVPLCTRAGQFGCVVAYSTYAEDPPGDSRFGIPEQEGHQVACTDPAALAANDDPLRLLVPSEPFAPGLIAAGIVVTAEGPPPSASTTWVVPPDRAAGRCATINGAHVLRLEPVGDSRRPRPFPDDSWGTHLIDVNLTLDKLLEIVRLQTERWEEPEIRLTRRCIGRGRMRVALEGDVEAVRDVNFKFGRAAITRDTEAPFSRLISRRTIGRRAGDRPVRAVAYLRAGAPRRVVLERRQPRGGCTST